MPRPHLALLQPGVLDMGRNDSDAFWAAWAQRRCVGALRLALRPLLPDASHALAAGVLQRHAQPLAVAALWPRCARQRGRGLVWGNASATCGAADVLLSSVVHPSPATALTPLPLRLLCPTQAGGDEDADRHHLLTGGRGRSGWASAARQPQQVEMMGLGSARSTLAATAAYIEDRLRRRARTESSQDEAGPSSGGSGGDGGGDGGFAFFHNRPPLFSASQQQHAAALANAGGQQLRRWKESLLNKLKKVASQPALAVPPGAAPGVAQLGAAAVASAPMLASSSASPDAVRHTALRQRSSAAGTKAD